MAGSTHLATQCLLGLGGANVTSTEAIISLQSAAFDVWKPELSPQRVTDTKYHPNLSGPCFPLRSDKESAVDKMFSRIPMSSDILEGKKIL